MKTIACAACALVVTISSVLAQDRPARFWNLTRHTIAEFYLAPAGTTKVQRALSSPSCQVAPVNESRTIAPSAFR